jgi:hypothetical protein
VAKSNESPETPTWREPLPYGLLYAGVEVYEVEEVVSALTLFLVGVAVVTWTLGREVVLDEA